MTLGSSLELHMSRNDNRLVLVHMLDEKKKERKKERSRFAYLKSVVLSEQSKHGNSTGNQASVANFDRRSSVGKEWGAWGCGGWNGNAR